MAGLESYQDRFRNVAFERREGVLEVRLHSAGGPAKWGVRSDSLHAELGEAFYAVAHDPDNRVVILTGTGDVFLTAMHPEEGPTAIDPLFWERMHQEGRDIVMNLLDIPVPVISAVNGPARVRAELATMGDVVLASEDAVFSDNGHFPSGAVPGDGVHVWWTLLLGINRGRAFLLTGEEIEAQEAQRLGVVHQVLPRQALMPRAWTLAKELSRQPPLVTRYARQVLVQHIKRRMLDELGSGLMYEGMALMQSAWATR